MVLPIVEFVFFKLRSSVKPEDPSNEEGDALSRILLATKQQSGYQSSAWGRAVEDENAVVWVIVWDDEHDKCQWDCLAPFAEPNSEVITIYSTLSPPVSETDTFTTNPITEIVTLAFPSSLRPEEHKRVNEDLINFRTALTERLPEQSRPKSWTMGQMQRPGTLQHVKSPSGQAFVYIAAVGWESVEAHMAARETKEFAESIQPIREKMIPPMPGLTMKHVSFRKI